MSYQSDSDIIQLILSEYIRCKKRLWIEGISLLLLDSKTQKA